MRPPAVPHPLESQSLGLEQALEQERTLLAEIRNNAGLVLDTTDYSVHDLRRVIQTKWSAIEELGRGMRVHIITFGFKYGMPSEADFVFDLRFLPNPYFDKSLRTMSGLDKQVSDYVLKSDVGIEFNKKFTEFMTYVLPLYADEGALSHHPCPRVHGRPAPFRFRGRIHAGDPQEKRVCSQH